MDRNTNTTFRESSIWRQHIKASSTIQEREKHAFLKALAWVSVAIFSIITVRGLSDFMVFGPSLLLASGAIITGSAWAILLSRQGMDKCEAMLQRVDGEFKLLADLLKIYPEELAKMSFFETRRKGLDVLASALADFELVNAKYRGKPLYLQPRSVEREWDRKARRAEDTETLLLKFKLIWSTDLDQATLEAKENIYRRNIIHFPTRGDAA